MLPSKAIFISNCLDNILWNKATDKREMLNMKKDNRYSGNWINWAKVHTKPENKGCWSPQSKAQIKLSKNIGSNSATSSCW